MDLKLLTEKYADCPCGVRHVLNTRVIKCESGLVRRVGKELKEAGFPTRILFLADKNTLKASNGILESLDGFKIVDTVLYDDLRVADMVEVEKLQARIKSVDGVLACGTGSIHDTARLACAREDKPLCLFATAPSMDGFASYGAPITNGNFKVTYPAKSPEMVLADSQILAVAPTELKSAGFGDMIGKYVGLIDWEVSSLITGEYWCDRVAYLTRKATDDIFALADRVTSSDEETAKQIFDSLILTGIGMSFTKTSRPASGTEHILSHFWECKKLLDGKISDFHGKKVGVATLLIMKEYEDFKNMKSVDCHYEKVDWDMVKSVYGPLWEEVERLNFPKSIMDGITPRLINDNWGTIRNIVTNVPSFSEIYDAMRVAGCATSPSEIDVSDKLVREGMVYHPYMRARLSLYRLKDMIR